jgi:hypothetical protein
MQNDWIDEGVTMLPELVTEVIIRPEVADAYRKLLLAQESPIQGDQSPLEPKPAENGLPTKPETSPSNPSPQSESA